MSRAVPLWGGIGQGGFGIVTWHKQKKLTQEEWVQVRRSGKLVEACRRARPDRTHGPWHILCDNEGFLQGKSAQCLYERLSVHLLHIPPRSPDLNPFEKFWAYLRKRLRAMDLQDVEARRPPVGRAQLKARVACILSSAKSKVVSKNLVRGLKRVCKVVLKKRGAASGL